MTTTVTIRRVWKWENVAVDVTSAKLSDPTGAFGIKRNDTDAVVVADGTDMTRVETGTYTYRFTPTVGVAHTAYVEFVYDGATFHFEVDIPAVSDASSLQVGWDELRAEVADYMGWTRDASKWGANEVSRLEAILRAGLLQVYYPERVNLRKTADAVHHWSWMRPKITIETVAAYETGTVEIAAGVVTLTGGTWPSWAASGELVVGSNTYTISTRDSDTQITLDDTSATAAAGASYSLGRSSYDLDATFDGSFDGSLDYSPGASTCYPPIKLTSDSAIRKLRAANSCADRPLYAAVRPSAYDATTGQRWEITFYPTPNAVYKLEGRYKARPTMIDSVNKYPMGGPAMSEVFLASCLAVAEQRYLDHQPGAMTQRFLALLGAAVENDANSFTPDFLGYNGDNSEVSADSWGIRHGGVPIHSFEGTVYYDHNP